MRALKLITAAILVLIGGMVGSFILDSIRPARAGEEDAPPMRRISAQAFILDDGAGHMRGWLATVDGTPSLTLLTADGKPAMDLSVQDDQAPRVILYDTEGHRRLFITIAEDTPAVHFIDAKGAPRMQLVSQPDDLSAVRIFGKESTSANVVMAVLPEGKGAIGLSDGHGTPIWWAP